MINLNLQSPPEVSRSVAERVRMRRKALKYTQAELARRAGMSLSSYKRFEKTGSIAFDSLIKIGFALGCSEDFEALFKKRAYATMQDVFDDLEGRHA